jgi:sugar/nucleoside kinase (ribokinase family)
MPAYVAKEIDPISEGNCFGGTFVTCRLMGVPVANASGAIAVFRKKPMEATSTFDELDEHLTLEISHSRSNESSRRTKSLERPTSNVEY